MIDPRTAIAIGLAAVLFSAGWMVRGWKEDAAVKAAQDAKQEAMQGAAEAIAKIKVTNTTIYQRATTSVIEKPVYRECQHDPETLGQINAALAPAP